MALFFERRTGRMVACLVVLVGLGIGIALVSARAAERSTGSLSNDSQRNFVDVCETGPDFASIAVGGLTSESGQTFVSISTDKVGTSRFVVSAAYGSAKHPAFRLMAQDAQGIRHPATSETVVAGAGSKYGVVTIDCEFDLAKKSIEQLILQRQAD